MTGFVCLCAPVESSPNDVCVCMCMSYVCLLHVRVSSGYENIDVSKHLSWPEIQQDDPDGQLKQQVTRLQVPSNIFLEKNETPTHANILGASYSPY